MSQTTEEAPPEEGRIVRVCPRCGAPYTYLERRARGGVIYYYAVHEEHEGGRRIRTKHYLGPEVYTAGQVTHLKIGVELEGATTPDPARLRQYLTAVLDAIVARRGEFSKDELEAVRRELERALAELK
ncbi:MAG: hypothetical protein ACPL2E_07715 [Conexivisphaera sp.]